MEATEAAGFPTLGQEILWQFGPSSLVHPAGPNCWKPKGGEASVCGAATPRARANQSGIAGVQAGGTHHCSGTIWIAHPGAHILGHRNTPDGRSQRR